MYDDVKKEHKQHGKLLKSLKRHFKKDEDEMDDEDEMQTKGMTLYQGKKDRRVSLNKDYDEDTEPHSQVYSSDGESTDEARMYGENAESNDGGYSSLTPEDDDEYEKKMKRKKEEDSQPMLPKSQRKRFGVAAIVKKMSKPKKSSY